MTKDTTGQIAMGFGDDRTTCLIGIDKGWYDGTIIEYNVRKFKTLNELTNISISNDLVQNIITTSKDYGMYSGGSLYCISQDQVDMLIKANQDIQATKDAKRVSNRLSNANNDARRVANGLCPKCGSYCYGDCTSN